MKNLALAPVWENEPYTFRNTDVNWFGGKTYEVSFEETPIRVVRGVDFEYMFEMVSLLNTAWNLGYSSGQVIGEFSERANGI